MHYIAIHCNTIQHITLQYVNRALQCNLLQCSKWHWSAMHYRNRDPSFILFYAFLYFGKSKSKHLLMGFGKQTLLHWFG